MKINLAAISAALTLCITLGFSQPAEARYYPCSKSKGGVSHCTSAGKHVFENGSVSRSKYKCTPPKK